jgi:hypothetical protein
MVKYEKLNPSIPFTNPVSIPFYGEVITARWGYEALAVRQYKDNKYESQFYVYDKAMSLAKYKKDFWYSQVKAKLESISSDLERGTRNEDFNNKLLLCYNEFKKELIATSDVPFDYVEMLTPDKVTPQVITTALDYVEKIRRYYVQYSNKAKDIKEGLLSKLQASDNEKFLKLRDNHTNKSLEEFVTNANETEKVFEFNNEVIQKADPIFMDPKGRFIKAHFYAPAKNVFGLEIDTFVINTIVLWFMTLLLYFALYFRLLKKILDSGEVAMGKKFKE